MTVHTLRIDGVDVAGSAGQTVLDVARENGIDIPTLCHLDGLSDVGACRLCCVEVAGAASAGGMRHRGDRWHGRGHPLESA